MSYLGALSAALALLSSCGAAGYATAGSGPVSLGRPGGAKRVVLQRGETRTFAPGALLPGDIVSCNLTGKPLRIRVPNRPLDSGWAVGTGAATPTGGTGELQLKSNPNSSVTASCGRKSS